MKRPEVIELLHHKQLEIYSIPQGRDNFAYVLKSPGINDVAIVDAMEPDSLDFFFKRHGWRLDFIFNTHHHYDHVGANTFFQNTNPTIQIFGGNYDMQHHRIPGQTRSLSHGEWFIWNDIRVIVLEIPGHTLGHIGYYFEVGQGHFFCGDTVFLGGCGRLFEGTPTQMDHSINTVIRGLGDEVSLYPAHEYSLSNIDFALSLQHEAELLDYQNQLRHRLSLKGTTLPTTIELEKKFNPFFRVRDQDYLDKLVNKGCIHASDTPGSFGQIRALKDSY